MYYPQRTFVLVSYLAPFSQKTFRDVNEFQKKNRGAKRDKIIIFFCKLNIKDQGSLHSNIYYETKTAYKFIKMRQMKMPF